MAQLTNKNRHTSTVAVGTGPAIHIKEGFYSITVGLHPGTSGKVEYTISSKDLIVADTANWVDWDAGDVTVGTIQVALGNVTGIRGVAVGSSATLEIVY